MHQLLGWAVPVPWLLKVLFCWLLRKIGEGLLVGRILIVAGSFYIHSEFEIVGVALSFQVEHHGDFHPGVRAVLVLGLILLISCLLFIIIFRRVISTDSLFIREAFLGA